jgi:hypothetical protein
MNEHRKHDHEPGSDINERRYKQHLDKITFRITVASTVIALLAAGAAFWSGWEAHKARVDDERPFVNVTPLNVDGDDQPLRTIIDARVAALASRSPARNVLLTCITAVDTPQAPVLWHPEKLPVTRTYSDILPDVWARGACPPEPGFIPTDDAHIIQLGTVQYEDEEHTHYLTPFCFTYKPVPQNSDPRRKADVALCDKDRGLPDLK